MIRELRSELLKVWTMPVAWIMLAIGAVLGGGISALAIFGGHRSMGFTRGTTLWYRVVLNGVGIMGILAMIIGIVVITTEYRHGSITGVLLAEPRRRRIVVAKLLCGVVVGVAFAIVGFVAALAVDIPSVGSQGGTISGLLHQVPAVYPGVLAAFALYAVLGVGVGALVRNQTLAIVIMLALLIIVEPIISAAYAWLGKWFPDAAASALSSDAVNHSVHNTQLLTWWGGGLVLLGYGLAAAAVGAFTTMRADIT